MKYLSIIHFSSLTEKNDIFVLEQFLPAYLSVYNFGGRQQLPITAFLDCFDMRSINQIANDLEWSTLANFFQKLECFHTHSMFQIKDLDVRGCSGGVSMQIDGVFSGGGMKGFALIGAIKAAEDKGFIFKRVAGTSAGSIAAALVAAGFNSQEMYDILIKAPRSSFLDSSFRNFPLIKWVMLYWKMGIYKGNAFEKWLTGVLATKNIHTFKDIERNSLRIIASDISNNRILVIPDDLPRYGINPDDFPVAKAVRMSISIPYIFRPVKVNKDVFVDGGLLSNFPIWLFEKPEEKPVRPVLGVQLTPKEKLKQNRKIRNSLELFSALFNSALRSHDLRYISRKVEKNIIFIKLKEGISTDFDMPKDECDEIFKVGEKMANKFFEKWSY